MKKKIIIVIVALLLFIPTYIAIASYNNAKNNPVTEGAVFKMYMRDIDGTEYTYEKGDGNDNATNDADANPISFFMELNENAQKISELPSALQSTGCYTVIYYSYNMQTAYNYYFTDNAEDAYYTDNNGNAYHIKQADANVFINSTFAIPLYKDAAAPKMTILDSEVLPQTMTWFYKMSNGQYSEAVVPLSTEETLKHYEVSGGLHISFTSEPDYLFVTVMQGDTRIFNDLYENISTLAFNDTVSLTVNVTARWYESDDKESYGEANYRYIADVRAPAEFYLGTSTVEHGDFVVITGKNVADISSISFKSEPDINFTPVFFEDGEYVVALVPISYELNYSSSYTFTITCDGMVRTLTLACTDKTFPIRECDYDKSIVATKRTPSTIQAFADETASAFAEKITTRYWDYNSAFSTPCNPNRQVRIGLGIYRKITATGTTYRHEGVDFMVATGDQVYAAASGVVTFVKTLDLSGRTIIIDHGFGLKTLYAHLSTVAVSEGDVVKEGDIIGVVGETGFTSGTSLHFGMYVFDVPVRPYDAFGWNDYEGIPVSLP